MAVAAQAERRSSLATRALPAARRYGPMVAACFALAWGISLGWWLLLPGTRTVELVVPQGAAEAVAAGRPDVTLPDRLELRRGDTLAIRNEDVSVHRVGTATVPPGHTVRIAVTTALLGAAGLLCSFHPSGSIGIAPLARPGIWHTAIPTLIAGVPLAFALVLTVAISSRLGGGREGES
ncbi:MAG: hypothetical protein EPO16_01880 [Dehalococcoidia bacterium]|nr:MAG: hypothetical protein EPO16_01880 [Dehalococcoidia bacterium]